METMTTRWPLYRIQMNSHLMLLSTLSNTALFLGKTNSAIQTVRVQATAIQLDAADAALYPVELIVMETALRLELQYQLSFSDVDETELLPIKLLPRPGNNGLAHKIRHR
jgi:NAD-dependent oxidoreductase involved in siderophore biosynthesis